MNIAQSYQSILDAVEFDDLPSTEQEKFIEDLNSTIFRGAVVRAIERMDEVTRDMWQRLIASGASEEALRRYLDRNAPTVEQALADTVDIVANDILAITSK